MIRLGTLGLCLALAGSALASEQRVAVLPISSPEPVPDLDVFQQQLRDLVHDALDGEGYTVLDDGAVRAALRTSASACGEHCAEEAEAALHADLYLAGEVLPVGGQYLAVVRLVDRNGRVISLAHLESVHIENLAPQLAAKAELFFAGKLHEAPLPKPEALRVLAGNEDGYSAATALELHLEPLAGHGQWTLYGRRDQALCVLPCVRWIGNDSGYVLRAADGSPAIRIQSTFRDAPWGAPMQGALIQPSGNVMLHPAWLALAAPVGVIGGIGSLGLTAALAISVVSGGGAPPEVVGIELGLIAVTLATIWWWVEIVRNMHHEGIDLTPLGTTPVYSALRQRIEWAKVVPPTRPER